MNLQKLNLLMIPLKFLLIFYVTKHSFKILTDEDQFYQNRGYNEFCQENKNPLDKKICESDKHSNFFFLYIDSVPYDLFKYKNEYFETTKNSNSYKIKHYGISDSGPVFSGFITGKIANKYEGRIGRIDNIFKQFSIAGHKVQGFGYNYPIEEMIGEEFFTQYKNIKEGLHEAFCEDFIKLTEVNISKYEFIKESLIFSNKRLFEKLNKYYLQFRTEMEGKKEKLFECLKKKLAQPDLSYFLYNVYTDVIGHQFSRQSEFFIKKIAALKVNLDLLTEFFEKFDKDRLLIILSDHGVISSLWEAELTNHGSPTHGNESFIFVKSSKIANNTNKDSYMNSYDVCVYLADLIKNVNYPMNSLGFSKNRKNDLFSKLVALRSKENQLMKYFATFESSFLKNKEIDIDSFIDSSPFKRIYGIFNDGDFDAKNINPQKLFEEYSEFIQKLENLQKIILDNKNVSKFYYNIILGLFIFSFLIFKNLVEIFSKIDPDSKKIVFILLLIFVFLPILFSINQKISTNWFFPYIFLTLSFLMIYLMIGGNLSNAENLKKKITIILVLNVVLKIFDYYVSFDNFYFFYYQNEFLQFLLILLHLAYSVYFLREIYKKKNVRSFNTRLINFFYFFYFSLDLIMVYYEVKLIFSFDYHQTKLMMILSRCFYLVIFLLFCLSFNFVKQYRLAIFITVIKLVFWFGNNFTRVGFYFFIIPFFWFYFLLSKKTKKTNSSLFTQLFDFVILIYQGVNIFLILRGELDTNISVRAAQKNWEMTLEEFPAFTGIIFFINKFIVFIFIYFFMLLVIKQNSQLDKKNFFNSMALFFDSLILKVTDIWFGFFMFIYLLNIDDAFNQRVSFMFNSANIILIATSYLFTIADFFISFFYTTHGYQKVSGFDQKVKVDLRNSPFDK